MAKWQPCVSPAVYLTHSEPMLLGIYEEKYGALHVDPELTHNLQPQVSIYSCVIVSYGLLDIFSPILLWLISRFPL